MSAKGRAAFTRINRTVLVLGVVSLLTDASSDMVWPLLPIFLTEQLHRSVSFVGLIEGVAEGTASLGKYLAGRYADRLPRKKPLVLLGYGTSSLVRPLLALASSPWHALLTRFADRVGKGIRSAPRDALLAASVTSERRAAAFGFHRAMDNLGAVVGPALAMIVLARYPGDLRRVFALSAIPGALAVLALLVLLRERDASPESRAPASPAAAPPMRAPAPAPSSPEPADHSPALVRYLGVVGLFTLANASDFFLIAKARDAGVSVRDVPLVWGALSLLRALSTTPGGWLADRVGRARALGAGWALYAVAYAGFAFARTPVALGACVLVYGAYYGLTEGAERALIAELAPRAKLGRAYGLFALVTGLGGVAASGLFGALYPLAHGRVSFLLAAALAAVASLAVLRVGAGLREAKPDSE